MKNVTICFCNIGNFERCSFTGVLDQVFNSATMKRLDCSIEHLDRY